MISQAAPIGIYIHVPFCLQKCPYCDFYSLPITPESADTYTDALLRAIAAQPYGEFTADTLYFGGGTPILLGPKRIGAIIDAAARQFHLDGRAEIAIEANPGAVTPEALKALRGVGCNRLSFGVQSLVDEELAALGRIHSAADALRSIDAALTAGFDNLSADLMLAIPGQATESMAHSIRELTATGINHISAYLLKIEEGTPFAHRQSALSLPDEDTTAQLYLDCVDLLEAHGFHQYEVSNFARGDAYSRHNLKYWRCEPYLGIGPSAHSFLGGRRFYFPKDLHAFLTAKMPFDNVIDDGPGGGPEEQLLLRLRLNEGCDLSALGLSAPVRQAMLAHAKVLEGHRLLSIHREVISLTPSGYLLSNSIIASLLERME